MAVAVMFPEDLLQHPATPVQKAMNTKKNAKMKRAMAERPISKINHWKSIINK
jgi:hypothetical protein